jgi:hypothetical protein
MKKTKKELSLTIKTNKEKLFKDLEKEIQEEVIEKIKSKAKKLIKEIRMTEILLKKQKKQLSDMLEGKRAFSEEEMLFED